MYVTDGTSGNKAVWVIKNTINRDGSIRREGNVINPITWSTTGCDIGDSSTYGLAIKQDKSTAYVTSPGVTNRLFTFNPLTSVSTGCLPYADNTFNTPRGVAWLDITDGRAYVANSFGPPILGVIRDGTFDRNINPFGSPNWVVVTAGRYISSLPGPSPSTRVR